APGPGGGGEKPPTPNADGKPEPPAEPKPAAKYASKAQQRRVIKGVYEDAAQRIADRLEPAMRREFLLAVEAVRGKVDVEALARAVDRNDVHAANAAIQVEQFAAQLQGARGVIETAFAAGGQAASTLLADAGIALSFRMNS